MTRTTCLDASPDCRGIVDYCPTPPDGLRAFVRCEFHSEQRWDRYHDSIESEAHSPLAPAWFDPSYAGERWDEDY